MTAVPDLAAKPVIDLMALVKNFDDAIPGLVDAAATSIRPHTTTRSSTVAGSAGHRRPSARIAFTLATDRALLAAHLRFRDELRTNPELRQEYAHVKHELAARYPNDRSQARDLTEERLAAAGEA